MRPLSLFAEVVSANGKLGLRFLHPGLRKGARIKTKFVPRIWSTCPRDRQTLPIKKSYKKYKHKKSLLIPMVRSGFGGYRHGLACATGDRVSQISTDLPPFGGRRVIEFWRLPTKLCLLLQNFLPTPDNGPTPFAGSWDSSTP